MHDSTPIEYFKIIKGCVERKLDARHWQWSARDSQLLDWCIQNMEGTYGR